MEITGRNSIGGPSTKLGFNKSKVTCFKCKQKGHFKRECRNSAADEIANPFHDDYYRKAVYHRNREEPPKMKQIKETPNEKSRALAVILDDEGFDWSEFLPEEDAVGYAFMATTEPAATESTYNRERSLAQRQKKKIYDAYKEAKKAKRWDPDRECYLDPKGNILIDPLTIDLETLMKAIPLVEEQIKISDAKRAEKERLKQEIRKRYLKSLEQKKVDEWIIDTEKEMTAENLKKMADQVLMAKALEVDSKSASSSDLSGKVSSSGSENESGKAVSAQKESVCKGCTKECKVCNTHTYLSNKRIQELVEKMVLIDKEVLSQDKLVKASSERIKELSEKIEKDKVMLNIFKRKMKN
ncbi:putative transcription factor interactor and regulator CCHC(Zn) family [Helianthus annuus]|nr:putative transcription factor interactor and regulator CCHC(Zn) family [Helianthus annuus]